jgi:hypothetical protein
MKANSKVGKVVSIQLVFCGGGEGKFGAPNDE